MYKKALEKFESYRKAAASLNLSKSKFIRLYKIELGLCQRRTSCSNKPEEGKTACRTCLDYVTKTSNKERRKAYNKKYVQENKEKRREYAKVYYHKKHEERRAYANEYYKTKYKEYNKEKRARNRASKKQATLPGLTNKDFKQIYKMCPKHHEVDHIIPLTHINVSGLHVPWNLQYLTIEENNCKSNKFDGTYENNSWRKDFK